MHLFCDNKAALHEHFRIGLSCDIVVHFNFFFGQSFQLHNKHKEFCLSLCEYIYNKYYRTMVTIRNRHNMRKRWKITHRIYILYILWSNALSHKRLCCDNHIWTTISEQNHYLHPKNKNKVKWYFSLGIEREFLSVGMNWKHKAKQTISLLPVSFVILFQKSESSVFFPITWYDHSVTLF